MYWARFRWQDGQLVCLEPDQIGKLSEICADLSEPTIALGDGWINNKDGLQSQSAIIEGPIEALYPSAKGIGRAGQVLLEQRQFLQEGCSPRYIQPSYAERPKSSV